MDCFEFNVPKKVDLLNVDDDDDMDTDDYFLLPKKSSQEACPSNNSTVAVNESPDEKFESVANKSSTDNVIVKEQIRQSPRILERMKTSEARSVQSRRRSLSVGAESLMAPKFNKIRKTPKPKKPVSIKPLKVTKPQEIKFSTDDRVKSRKRSMSSEDVSKDFARSLRSCAAKSNNLMEKQRGPTKVQPFHLHESKPKLATAEPFVSMAELDLQYWKKTPQRFRSKAHIEPHKKAVLTIPHTPNLTARTRTRSIADIPTREQIEEKELEEALKHQFKAQKLNKKVFQAPPPICETRKVTIPEPFDITDSKKEGLRILKACEDAGDISTSSLPYGGVPRLLNNKKSTLVKPFSFHSRDNETLKKKNDKIKKVLEEEKKLAEFHAHPMPVFEGVQGLPKKKTPQKTIPKPFNLKIDERGMTRQQIMQKEMEELERLENEKRKFKAQPDSVLHKQPFIPEKSTKPLTDISKFTLNTEKRSEDRQDFEVHLKQKEDQIMAEKRENEERLKAEEEAEIQRMRKEAVHKAQPVKKFKPVEIKQGLKPPTVPLSPDFATDSRLRLRGASSRQDVNSTTAGDATFNS